MNLLILVACLLIERYLHIGSALKRFSWFEGYLSFLQAKIRKDSPLSKGYLAVVVAVLPLLFVLLCLYILAVHYQLALSGIGLFFILLLYCFGPSDLYDQLNLYFRAVEEKEPEHMAYIYEDITGTTLDNTDGSSAKASARKLTKTIFARANCSIFSILFWFWVGGPLMVLVYRLLCLMASLVAEGKEVSIPFAYEATRLYGWLNWMPARATALFYSIAGGSQAYAIWKKNFWSGVSNSENILTETGVNSLPTGKELSPIEENQAAVVLVDHALMIFVGIMFAFTLGAWLR
jgi:membrane protein required for beta-lactamase induction